VGAAFTILSDAEKRAHYDRFGGDEASVSSGTQGGGRDFARRQHYARYEEEISPEDIFNMFFGGGLPPGGMRVRGGFRTTQANFHQQHAGNQQQQQQPGNARFVQLLQLLPLLLLFLFSILSFRSGGDDKLFGLTRDDVFRTERKTSLYGVTSGLPYFVKDDFWSRVSSDRSILTRVSVKRC
jgi:curved DNA-binding protein CbpA